MCYIDLSYKEAVEKIIEEQLKGNVCLLFPFLSINNCCVKGFQIRPYDEKERVIEYYLKVIQEEKDECGQNYLKNRGR